jgi:hypothetical protein
MPGSSSIVELESEPITDTHSRVNGSSGACICRNGTFLQGRFWSRQARRTRQNAECRSFIPIKKDDLVRVHSANRFTTANALCCSRGVATTGLRRGHASDTRARLVPRAFATAEDAGSQDDKLVIMMSASRKAWRPTMMTRYRGQQLRRVQIAKPAQKLNEKNIRLSVEYP